MRGWLPPTQCARHEEDDCRGHRGLFKLIAILAAIFVAISGTIAVAVTFGMKHGEVYETTWAAVQADPRVVSVTGTPITRSPPSVTVNLVGSGGKATIRYDISGPTGRGTVEATGMKTEGQWHMDRFVFEPEGDATRAIDLAKKR